MTPRDEAVATGDQENLHHLHHDHVHHHHGLPLLPRPSNDDRDPLRWTRGLKLAALIATAFVNFTANFAGSGLSVAVPVLEQQFRKDAAQVNALLTVDCTTFNHRCRADNRYSSTSYSLG